MEDSDHFPGNLSLARLAGACKEGDVEFVRLLLSGGAQVDARGPDGATPLLAAADGGFVKYVIIFFYFFLSIVKTVETIIGNRFLESIILHNHHQIISRTLHIEIDFLQCTDVAVMNNQ